MGLERYVPQRAKTPILVAYHTLAVLAAIVLLVDRLVLARVFLRYRFRR
jgi:hypothetical protein